MTSATALAQHLISDGPRSPRTKAAIAMLPRRGRGARPRVFYLRVPLQKLHYTVDKRTSDRNRSRYYLSAPLLSTPPLRRDRYPRRPPAQPKRTRTQSALRVHFDPPRLECAHYAVDRSPRAKATEQKGYPDPNQALPLQCQNRRPTQGRRSALLRSPPSRRHLPHTSCHVPRPPDSLCPLQ